MLRCLIFLGSAGLNGRLELVEDSPEQRAYVTEKIGAPASFPALEHGGTIIQYPAMDELIDKLAELFDVDMSTCYAYHRYVEGVYPRYQKMMGKLIGIAGGWPKMFPSIGVRRILVIGASGMVGSRLVNEAKLRGHEVVRASRSGDVQVDANDAAAVENVIKTKAINYLICALGPSRTNPNAPKLTETYKSVITACKATDTRVFFVGGAASLKVAEGGPMIIDTPDFPAEVKNEAGQHWEGLQYLRTIDDVIWTYLSPAPMIAPGKRTKQFRLGGDDDLIVGGEISAEDFAIAALDEVDTPKYDKKRFAVAY